MRITRIRDIGRLIRARRQELRWSQTELAQRAGTTRRWISEIENGKATAEIGLVLATLRTLDIELRLEVPGARPDARTPALAPEEQPTPADLAAILAEHTDAATRPVRPVTFRRTNR